MSHHWYNIQTERLAPAAETIAPLPTYRVAQGSTDSHKINRRAPCKTHVSNFSEQTVSTQMVSDVSAYGSK